MAYREITMIEIKEVLRRWVSGIPKKRLAAQLGLDPKTVRRYVKEAENCGVRLEDGLTGLTDELVGAVVVALKQPAAHPHGDPWWACEAERSIIEAHLKDGLRLTKILRLLTRKGVQVPYSTLHRFAVQELGFGRKAATMPVADGDPSHAARALHPRRGPKTPIPNLATLHVRRLRRAGDIARVLVLPDLADLLAGDEPLQRGPDRVEGAAD